MTVGQLLHSISSAELTEWMAFLTLENEPEHKAAPASALRAAFAHMVVKEGS